MRLTHNAISMLTRAYRACLKNSYIKNLAAVAAVSVLGFSSAYANTPDYDIDPADFNYIIVDTVHADRYSSDDRYDKLFDGKKWKELTGLQSSLSIEGQTDYKIYLDGGATVFVKNKAEQGSVDTIEFGTQSVDVLLGILSGGNGAMNYAKNSGGEFEIGHLKILNTDLVGSDLQNITGILSAIKNKDKKELLKAITAFSKETYLNIGNLEFLPPTDQTMAQSFKVGTAEIGPYSLLRVNKSADYKATTTTTVSFDEINLDNLAGVGLGVVGGVGAPNEVYINTLNLSAGGPDFAYSAVLGNDNNTVNVGTINITGNTLDLSGSLFSGFGQDLIGYLQSNKSLTDLADKLEELKQYAPQADLALAKGELAKTILNSKAFAQLAENLGLDEDDLEGIKILGTILDLDGRLGAVTGVTLAGIDGNAVTVNMNTDTLDNKTLVPELMLGNVAADTAVNVNFNEAALNADGYQKDTYSKTAIEENAIVLKGSFVDGASLNLHYTDGVSSEDEIAGVLEELAAKVTIGSLAEVTAGDAYTYEHGNNPNAEHYADGNFTVNVDAFGLMDGYTADLVANEEATQDEAGYAKPDFKVDQGTICINELNTNIDTLLDPAVLSAMMWRTQMDNLVNRLGDLHEANAANGLWVRAYGGNQDFDDRNIDNNYYGIQIGYDHNMGYGWTLGSALSYTQGDADFDKGSSDAYAFDLAVYGTWLHESGFYTDLVAKFGVVNTDNSLNFHNPNISASDSANSTAFGLSAEVGFKYDVNDLFYIEPQAQLSYSHIGDADASYGPFTADYKDINMLIGRVGFRAGVNLPEDYGSVYLRANGLKDFNGDVDADLDFDNGAVPQSRSVSEEMDDAWYEVGLGTTLKFNDSFYVYAECMYADGGDVDAIYGNLGARLMF